MGYKNYEQQKAAHASMAEKKKGSKGPSKHGSIKSDENYDAKMAYNKNLSKGARLHYLENNIADHKGGSWMSKHSKSR
tara:strand:+ start:370 stop:603 length:234 start_codon:yes stop_codon:yes gene_type:complete